MQFFRGSICTFDSLMAIRVKVIVMEVSTSVFIWIWTLSELRIVSLLVLKHTKILPDSFCFPLIDKTTGSGLACLLNAILLNTIDSVHIVAFYFNWRAGTNTTVQERKSCFYMIKICRCHWFNVAVKDQVWVHNYAHICNLIFRL